MAHHKGVVDWHLPCIYYVQDIDNRLVKIGTTTDASTRLASIGRKTKQGIRILGFEAGGYDYETKLHGEFASLLDHGEWFRPGPDLMDHIARATKPRLQDVVDRLWPGDADAALARLEAQKATIEARIDEYQQRRDEADRVSPGVRIANHRPARLGTMAYSMAWRNQWEGRLKEAAEANTEGSWDAFLVWYAGSVFEAIVARAFAEERAEAAWRIAFGDSPDEYGDGGPYGNFGHYCPGQYHDRCMVRHFQWCRRLQVHPELWSPLASAPGAGFAAFNRAVGRMFGEIHGSGCAGFFDRLRLERKSGTFDGDISEAVADSQRRYAWGRSVASLAKSLDPPLVGDLKYHFQMAKVRQLLRNIPEKMVCLIRRDHGTGRVEESWANIDKMDQGLFAEVVADRVANGCNLEALHFARLARQKFGDDFIECCPDVEIDEDGELILKG